MTTSVLASILVSDTGLTVTGNGSDEVWITGDEILVSAALNSMNFTPASDFVGNETITKTAFDDGSDPDTMTTVTVNVTAENDPPTLSLATIANFNSGDFVNGPQSVYAAPVADDIDSADFDGGVLAVRYASGTPGTGFDQLSLETGSSVGDFVVDANGNVFILVDDGQGGTTGCSSARSTPMGRTGRPSPYC